ncbi:MAG TPA: glycosyltransferase 87 family protein [Thermoanaerobaculia bacterium]|nr:glycosyltransferase 87 family protein [Thermoanaerobaculia bacterium]
MSRALEQRTFLLICLFCILARLALVAMTYGSNDMDFVANWAALANHVGISRAYLYTRMVNHPPASLALMSWIMRLSEASGISFPDLFRTFQVLADALTAAALYRIGGQKLALFVLLSPGAAFVSAFHGNTDATMTALLVLAIALAIADRPALAGTALALAAGIKIIPFLAAPLFLAFFERRARILFLVAFAIATAILFGPAIAIGGPVVIRNIFGYAGGLPWEWGFTGVAFAISRKIPTMRAAGDAAIAFYSAWGRYFVYAGIAAVFVLVFAKRNRETLALPHAIEIMLMTILALAPGFGVQYIGWLIPLLPFAFGWRAAIALNAAMSAFLFITYTVWSGGWPWWFADLARPGPYRYVAALAGCAMWMILCVALVVAVRRFTRTTTPETAS